MIVAQETAAVKGNLSEEKNVPNQIVSSKFDFDVRLWTKKKRLFAEFLYLFSLVVDDEAAQSTGYNDMNGRTTLKSNQKCIRYAFFEWYTREPAKKSEIKKNATEKKNHNEYGHSFDA